MLLAGCGEDAQQRRATRAAEAYAGGKARCTQSARTIGTVIHTTRFLCDVKRRGGLCDELLVIERGGRYSVEPRRRGVDCIVPA